MTKLILVLPKKLNGGNSNGGGGDGGGGNGIGNGLNSIYADDTTGSSFFFLFLSHTHPLCVFYSDGAVNVAASVCLPLCMCVGVPCGVRETGDTLQSQMKCLVHCLF